MIGNEQVTIYTLYVNGLNGGYGIDDMLHGTKRNSWQGETWVHFFGLP